MSTETVVLSQAHEVNGSTIVEPTERVPSTRHEPDGLLSADSNHLWHLRAACRGPHQQIFYPPNRFERRVDKRRREERAKEICRTCSVSATCRQQAIQRREAYGIWGGLTEHERRQEQAPPKLQ